MIQDNDLPELRTYRNLEKTLPIEFAPQLGGLVISGDSELMSVHRWFKYKEAYSPALVWEVLSAAGIKIGEPLSLLDPFCGVGTTLVSAQANTAQVKCATGIRAEPILCLRSTYKALFAKNERSPV